MADSKKEKAANRRKVLSNSRVPKTFKSKYFSDFVKPPSRPLKKARRLSQRRASKQPERQRGLRWKSTDRKMKNLTGCFSNFPYASHPYKGAYDKVGSPARLW